MEHKRYHFFTNKYAINGSFSSAQDHTALDAESRVLLAVVPGKRTGEQCQKVVDEVKKRTEGRTDLLITSDEHAPYETAIKQAYEVEAHNPMVQHRRRCQRICAK